MADKTTFDYACESARRDLQSTLQLLERDLRATEDFDEDTTELRELIGLYQSLIQYIDRRQRGCE